MNIYNAIMAAADHIERNPVEFDFNRWCIPSCGTPGCALGWIGFFAGMEPDICGATRRVPSQILGLTGYSGDDEFYQRMTRLAASSEWRWSASLCAKGLRLYAEKYHRAAGLDPAFVKFKGDLNELIVSKSLSHRPL